MSYKQHFEILGQGADVWNEWRENEFYTRPQLRDVDFRNIDLTDVSLWEADLSGANLSGKDLSGRDLMDVNLTGATLDGANLNATRLASSNLYLADLRGANLFHADLQAVDFRNANASDVDMRETYLGGANFTGAVLDRARFDGSLFNATLFGNNDLRTVTGLESINHNGPSIIGIDTLYRSMGSIPAVFLQGAGISDDFIQRIPSLIESRRSDVFDSCFVSHSHLDEDFCQYLIDRMRQVGIRVWFSPEHVQGGKKTIEQIRHEIENNDRVLVVLSSHSLESEWVKTEIRIAAGLEKLKGRRKLFPIRLIDMKTIDRWSCFDADLGKDLAVELREYHIPDFGSWNEDPARFEIEFSKLITALQKEARKRESSNGTTLRS